MDHFAPVSQTRRVRLYTLAGEPGPDMNSKEFCDDIATDSGEDEVFVTPD